MKQIEIELKRAWEQNQPVKFEKDEILQTNTGALELKSLGVIVARKEYDGTVKWTMGGRDTATVRSRLRNVVGARVAIQRRKETTQWHSLNGEVLPYADV